MIIAIAIQRVDGLLGIRLIVIADKCKPLYCTTHIQTMSIEGHDTETRQYSSPHYRRYSNTEGSPEFAAFMHELWAVYQKPRDTFLRTTHLGLLGDFILGEEDSSDLTKVLKQFPQI